MVAQDTQLPSHVGAFSPVNTTLDRASISEHERDKALPDSKWRDNKSGWQKQAVAAVREERHIVRDTESRRAGMFVHGYRQCLRFFSPYGSVCRARPQRPGLPRAPGLLSHAEVTKNIIFFQWAQHLGTHGIII